MIASDLAWFPAYQSHHPRPVYSIFVRVITVNSTRHAFATALRQPFRFLQDRRQGQLILRYLLINGNAKAMNMSWLSLERGRLTTTGSCTSGGLKLKISSLALSLHVLWATFRRSTIVFQVGYHQDKYPSLLSLSFLLHGVIRACSSSDITHPPCTMHSIEFLLKRRIIWYILSLGVMRGCFPSSMGLLYPPYLNMSIRVRFGYTPHQCRCRTRIHLSSAYSTDVHSRRGTTVPSTLSRSSSTTVVLGEYQFCHSQLFTSTPSSEFRFRPSHFRFRFQFSRIQHELMEIYNVEEARWVGYVG